MRGGQGRQPLTSPRWKGLGNTACSLECLACLNHVHGWTIWGWLRYLASQTPLSRSIGSLASCSATVRLDLGDLGIIEQQLNQSSNQLGLSLCPVVMHSPVTGLFRVLWIGFLLPTIRPRFNVRLGIPNRLSIQHCNVEDGLLR